VCIKRALAQLHSLTNMKTLDELDMIFSIREIVCNHSVAYRKNVIGPAMNRLRICFSEDKYVPASRGVVDQKARGTARTDEASNIHIILTMEDTLFQRLAADGPQEASFCPHPLYLFSWRAPRARETSMILKNYMSSYAAHVSLPILDAVGKLERQFHCCFAAAVTVNSGSIDRWSEGIRAINRSYRFFERRSRHKASVDTFFQEM
jgi:hypothetical protein